MLHSSDAKQLSREAYDRRQGVPLFCEGAPLQVDPALFTKIGSFTYARRQQSFGDFLELVTPQGKRVIDTALVSKISPHEFTIAGDDMLITVHRPVPKRNCKPWELYHYRIVENRVDKKITSYESFIPLALSEDGDTRYFFENRPMTRVVAAHLNPLRRVKSKKAVPVQGTGRVRIFRAVQEYICAHNYPNLTVQVGKVKYHFPNVAKYDFFGDRIVVCRYRQLRIYDFLAKAEVAHFDLKEEPLSYFLEGSKLILCSPTHITTYLFVDRVALEDVFSTVNEALLEYQQQVNEDGTAALDDISFRRLTMIRERLDYLTRFLFSSRKDEFPRAHPLVDSANRKYSATEA